MGVGEGFATLQRGGYSRAMEMSGRFVEGKAPKRFRIYRLDINGEPYESLGEYDSISEVQAHRYRQDWRYKIRVNGKWLTRREFDAWAKEQSRPES
jgi:hypothetical protein